MPTQDYRYVCVSVTQSLHLLSDRHLKCCESLFVVDRRVRHLGDPSQRLGVRRPYVVHPAVTEPPRRRRLVREPQATMHPVQM